MSGLDHFIKEYLRIEGYVRYMDDLVLFADEKDTLRQALTYIEAYLGKKLCLKLKQEGTLAAPVSQGLSFLGFRVFPGVIRMARRGWRRFRRKVMALDGELCRGVIDDETWRRSAASLVGHLRQAQTRNLRAPFFSKQSAILLGKEVSPLWEWLPATIASRQDAAPTRKKSNLNGRPGAYEAPTA